MVLLLVAYIYIVVFLLPGTPAEHPKVPIDWVVLLSQAPPPTFLESIIAADVGFSGIHDIKRGYVLEVAAVLCS